MLKVHVYQQLVRHALLGQFNLIFSTVNIKNFILNFGEMITEVFIVNLLKKAFLGNFHF